MSNPSTRGAKVVRIDDALAELAAINAEIRHKGCIEGDGFHVGLVSFAATSTADPRQIIRAGGEVTSLHAGMLCHIPAGVPHDFAAEEGDLVLCYSLITTRQ